MPDLHSELPSSPPTSGSGPAIDPSSTAVPAVPRPTAPAPPSATSSPWFPHFEMPSAAPAGPRPMNTAPARARRAAAASRTRAVVGGTSVAAFLAILAAIGLHGDQQPVSAVGTSGDGSPARFDPGFARPNLGQGVFGNTSGGFSATPGSGTGSAHTRSHGS